MNSYIQVLINLFKGSKKLLVIVSLIFLLILSFRNLNVLVTRSQDESNTQVKGNVRMLLLNRLKPQILKVYWQNTNIAGFYL